DSGCRIVVESGGYAYASIRLAAPQAPQDGATFIAHGRQAAYGDPRIEGILRDVAPGVEPAGDVRLWRRPDRPRAGAPPASRGEPAAPASCVALALRHAEQDLGVLHILSDDEAAFPPEEIELLRELASDLAFGLVTLRARAAEIAREAALAEAVRVARQRSQFIAQMSHELRTPLNAILGCAQLLDHAPDEAVRRRRLVKILLDSGDHLLALIEDILDLARIDAGKLELRAVPIRLDEFFESVSEISRVKAEEKHLQFRLALAPGLPVAVAADGKRLRQVLLNLLSNSVKFTDSGAVSLRVSRVGADTPAPGAARHVARLRFEIEDTGVGMNEEQSSRLFQPFEQVGDSARRQGGAGLGLAISLPLIRLMGGDIQVRSAIGRGSTFSFELDFPVCDDAA
ncbi:MAG TPA: ATP-binding protein, partial [Burkholderiaceae bacterium]|nr:ATP-binding protein [Burkholderiaceae bacterium]